MSKIAIVLFGIALALSTPACSSVDYFEDRFVPATYGADLPPTVDVQIVEVNNVPTEVVQETDFPDSEVIGRSSFMLNRAPSQSPIDHARRIGADVVIVSRTYDNTRREKQYHYLRNDHTRRYRRTDAAGNTIYESDTYTDYDVVPQMRNVDYYRYEALFLRTSP